MPPTTTSAEPTSGPSRPGGDDVGGDRLDDELTGLDNLELGGRSRAGLARRAWSVTWPKLAAVAIAIAFWQCVVWSGWRPTHVLPPPLDVFEVFWDGLTDGTLFTALRVTMQRAAIGYAIALVVGLVIGALVSRIRVLRIAVGSLITGLMTMPSIAWFPLAILIFKLSESAILFVVVIGAAPAIANGLIAGVDNIPPLLLRAGRVLGARRVTLYRHVILPASLPSLVGGLKQGWAFAWRSLMAGELLVIIAGQTGVGFLLQLNRDLNDAAGLIAVMILILLIGIVVDIVLFGTVERVIRKRWGLVDAAATP
jgi:NitT/TauT family transport system permease protein